MESYEQLEITSATIGDKAKLLKENLEVYISSYEGEILGIDLPDKVELVITHTEPAVKGNTTNNALKDAECETGLMVRVPLFIEEGETIIVSTADGKYVSRA
jgi:elongation factor P